MHPGGGGSQVGDIPPVGVCAGGSIPLARGLGQCLGKFCFSYIYVDPRMEADPKMAGGPTQGFVHGFGHDGFLPMVFCRYGQGNYGYVLIQS